MDLFAHLGASFAPVWPRRDATPGRTLDRRGASRRVNAGTSAAQAPPQAASPPPPPAPPDAATDTQSADNGATDKPERTSRRRWWLQNLPEPAPQIPPAPSIAVPVERVVGAGPRRIARMQPGSGGGDLWMTRACMESLASTIGALRSEEGGPLGGDRRTGVVTHFMHDTTAVRDAATYSPDVEFINRVFAEEWNPANVNMLGYVHSHPNGIPIPSGGDLHYARRILTHTVELDRLLIPIVQSVADRGRFGISGHAALRASGETPMAPRPKRLAGRPDLLESSIMILPDGGAPSRPLEQHPAFERVVDAYDLAALASTRVVIVGVGGSASFAESLARCGVGEIVLIDPDVVEETNLATQQTYLNDVGLPKVDVVARRIAAASPTTNVVTLHAPIEALNHPTLRVLLHRPLPGSPYFPSCTLMCAFTDDFWAQAETARLALAEGVPLLAAQVYRDGAAAEVVFVAAGHTPACHRCVLRPRYEAFAGGYTNTVTSHGTPLYATERLNAAKSMIAMAMLHTMHPRSDPTHPATRRFTRLFERIGNRNLVQIRLDPFVADTLGLTVFDRVFDGADPDRVVCDETVWLPQDPEDGSEGRPVCADCGGSGDLAKSVCEPVTPLKRPSAAKLGLGAPRSVR